MPFASAGSVWPFGIGAGPSGTQDGAALGAAIAKDRAGVVVVFVTGLVIAGTEVGLVARRSFKIFGWGGSLGSGGGGPSRINSLRLSLGSTRTTCAASAPNALSGDIASSNRAMRSCESSEIDLSGRGVSRLTDDARALAIQITAAPAKILFAKRTDPTKTFLFIIPIYRVNRNSK